jgi:AcrR family transcriptional regulator
MGRWEPGARGRLEAAALELVSENGFDRTTVAEIAARAGVTERTFFRYFADKREVLFSGGKALEEFLVGQVVRAPDGAGPLDAIAGALNAAATEIFAERHSFARQRQAAIDSNSELQERELLKLAALTKALAAALRDRGTSEPAASLAAESGVAVFKTAFARWVSDGNTQDLCEIISETLTQLREAVNVGNELSP